MATFQWQLQGTSPTTIDPTDILQFAGAGGFNTRIAVGAYNDSTHVKASGGGNDSSANTPRNNKYVNSTQVSVNGAAAKNLTALTTAEAALKINFSDASAVAIESAILYAFDGTTPATAPVGVTFKAAEQGDSTWTDAEGSGSPLTLNDKVTPATSHDYYVAVSMSPDSVGAKAFAIRCELTYY